MTGNSLSVVLPPNFDNMWMTKEVNLTKLLFFPPTPPHSEHAAHGAKEITEGDAICAPALEEAVGYRAQSNEEARYTAEGKVTETWEPPSSLYPLWIRHKTWKIVGDCEALICDYSLIAPRLRGSNILPPSQGGWVCLTSGSYRKEGRCHGR